MFTPKTLEFLAENRRRNSQAWFAEHKEAYHTLVFEPLCELVRALAPQALQIDDQVVSLPRVDKTICRIRRDTRFSHDKSLYRENMWVIFRRIRMHEPGWPGLYFEVSPEGFSYGCGFYHAPPGYLDTVRGLILEGDADAKKAMSAYARQSVFALHGQQYKRARFTDQPPAVQDWLNRRNLSFTADSTDFDLLFSRHLAETIRAGYETLAPVYQFLLKASLVFLEKASPTVFYPGGGKEFEF